MKVKHALCGVFMAAYGMTANGPVPADELHWTYEEQAEWGALEDASKTTPPLMYPNAVCAIGERQSPIDLAGKTKAKTLNLLKMKYVVDLPDFFNSGHAVQVNTTVDYQGTLYVGKDAYPLTQYHFHAPSEHVIGSKIFAGELHFVHIRPDGRMAVVGVFLEEGEPNPAFQTILDNVPATAKTHNKDSGIKLNPRSLLPKDKKHFYTYAGSLTTPPCHEGVQWFMLAKPITVSPDQIAKLESLYDRNNRLPQTLNDRTVTGNVK
jgi:carbonic anhydrase